MSSSRLSVSESADLSILARELQAIAETGYLPDGDGVQIPVMLWAEGWLLTLAELGVAPAPRLGDRSKADLNRGA